MAKLPKTIDEVFAFNLYINLDTRPDRLEHVRNELDKVGIVANSHRIRAIKTMDGALGCTLSHIRCLEEAIAADAPCVFICEDDITFTNPALLRKNLAAFLVRDLAWDVIIIGGNLVDSFSEDNRIVQGASNTSIFCRVANCQTTTGYIVARHYYETLIANFRESAAALARGAIRLEAAIDMSWKRLQPSGAWYMILPATVTQYENYSDIEERIVQYHGVMLDTEKRWLRR
jgi:GR25 family glycosyltransferase involved in LPS biosynthesis